MVYCRYLKWTEQHLPQGKNHANYEKLLEKYIQKFHTWEQYKYVRHLCLGFD